MFKTNYQKSFQSQLYNKAIEDHCYKIGVPVDLYFELISRRFQSVEEWQGHISELEKICDCDGGFD